MPKPRIFERAIHEAELPVSVRCFDCDLDDRDAVLALAECDVLFGCTDSAKGRDDLSKIAAFYCQPYIDMGLLIESAPSGGVRCINGHVNYLAPGELGLLEFGIYTMEQVRAEALRKQDPTAHAIQVSESYIVGVPEDSPSVISLNGLVASHAVNELLFRLHPCRADGNVSYRAMAISVTEMNVVQRKPLSNEINPFFLKNIGMGRLFAASTKPSARMKVSLRRLATFLKNLRSTTKPEYKWAKVESCPMKPDPKTIYLAGDREVIWDAPLVCPCRCGDIIKLSLMSGKEAFWRVTIHADKTVSISPSVWRRVGCRSHFWVRRSRLMWASRFETDKV